MLEFMMGQAYRKVRAFKWAEEWRTPIQVFVTVRIMASVAAILGVNSFPANGVIPTGGYIKPAYSGLMELVFGIWERCDALWYIRISQSGYGGAPSATVFMPLYPMLVGALAFITRLPPIVSAILVSNVAFFLALVYLYRLAQVELGPVVAGRSLWYLALFPGSFFLLAPYSESLFLCLAVASILAVRQDRFIRAGILGAFLALTRNLGIVIGAALLVEAILRSRGRWNLSALKRLLGAALPAVGLAAWMFFLYLETGDPLAFVHQQAAWQRQSSLPWDTVLQGARQAWETTMAFHGGVYLFEILSVAGALLLAGLGLRKLPASFTVFLLLGMLPPLLAPYPGRMLMSCMRFVAVLFPAFLTLATLPRKESTDLGIRVCFAGAYGIAVAMYVCNQNMF